MKANEKNNGKEVLFIISTEYIEPLLETFEIINEKRPIDECISFVDKIYPDGASNHGDLILSCPSERISEFKDVLNALCVPSYRVLDAALCRQDTSECDVPHLTKHRIYIEMFVDLSIDNLNDILPRCDLKYGDDETRVLSVNDLREDTWIEAFVYYGRNDVFLELQIDGVFSTQGFPAKLNLTASEHDAITQLLERSCQEHNLSFDDMKSKLRYKAERAERE